MNIKEAERKIMEHHPNITQIEANKLVFALKALGLIKFDKIELICSSRPVDWDYLKRDLDQFARDILAAHNPDAMKYAVKNFKYLEAELASQ